MLSTTTSSENSIALDLENQCLWRASERVALTPKSFGVLRYLVEHREQLVTTESLLKAVWPRATVEPAQVKQFIAELRKLLGDDAEKPRYIETVRGRGYRFVGRLNGPAKKVPDTFLSAPTGSPQNGGENQFLYGRNSELRHLKRMFDDTVSGSAPVCLITGEPGIGKSALAATFVNEIQTNHDVWVVRAQCIEPLQCAEPFQPVLSGIEELCDRPAAELVTRELRRVAPLWLLKIPGVVEGAELERIERQNQGAHPTRMLREFCRLLESLANHKPVLFWLEDLQWADEYTQILISHLVSQPKLRRVMLLATTLPMDPRQYHAQNGHISSNIRLGRADAELALRPLTEENILQYLEARLPLPVGGAGKTDRIYSTHLAQLIYQRSDGHPLITSFLVEQLIENGLSMARSLNSLAENLNGRSGVVMDIPSGLRQFVLRQLGRVDKEAWSLLEVASVAGVTFSSALLAEGLQWDIDKVENQCEGLAQRKAFVQRVGVTRWPDGTYAGEYRFIYSLYRDIILESIPVHRLGRLHQIIGERLERAFGDRCMEIAAQLVLHFRESHDTARADRYALMLARPQINGHVIERRAVRH